MNVTIYGPNLPRVLADKGTFHVHRSGCAHTARHGLDGLGDRAPWNRWAIDADTVLEVVTEVYEPECFDYDPTDLEAAGQFIQDLHFAPCTKELVPVS